MIQLSAPESGDVAEGRAKLHFDFDDHVFYNPKMAMNRDIAVLFVKSYFNSSRIRICDPMTASGVRAVRYLLECQNVEGVTLSDKDAEAVRLAEETIQLNQLKERASIVHGDANMILSNYSENKFDLIDLDPFGTPAPFFETSLRAITSGGILAATATDMAPLTGVRSAACFRKYNVKAFRTEFEKEVAVRVLATSLGFTSGRLELGLQVLFAHASDHYARIYVKVTKGKHASNDSMKSIGYLEYCSVCFHRAPRKSVDEIQLRCEVCGSKSKILGPIWLDSIWDTELVHRMSNFASVIRSSQLSKLHRLLERIEGEVKAPPFYYRVDRIADRIAANPPKVQRIVSELRLKGYNATLTHFHPNGFRTNAPDEMIRRSILRLAEKAQTKEV